MTRFLTLVMTLFTPALLCLMAVRVIMSPLFLQVEYTRPGFPDDPYGLTQSERLHFGPRAVMFLVNDEPVDVLRSLTYADETPLFNERELVHMRDVQTVTKLAFLAASILGILYGASSIWLFRRDRMYLAAALRRGGIATLSVLAAVIVFAVAAWDRFFVLFHTVLFTDGTWYFPTSDSLIRLFPEQFWFDAALAVGLMTFVGAGVVLLLARLISSKSR